MGEGERRHVCELEQDLLAEVDREPALRAELVDDAQKLARLLRRIGPPKVDVQALAHLAEAALHLRGAAAPPASRFGRGVHGGEVNVRDDQLEDKELGQIHAARPRHDLTLGRDPSAPPAKSSLDLPSSASARATCQGQCPAGMP